MVSDRVHRLTDLLEPADVAEGTSVSRLGTADAGRALP